MKTRIYAAPTVKGLSHVSVTYNIYIFNPIFTTTTHNFNWVNITIFV